MISTRERLLREGTRLFAELGYDGAATEAIVSAAKVNKRMLYHYFGSKEGLYRAVLEAEWTAFGAALGGVGASDLLHGIVDASFDYVAARPALMRLAMWEGLRGGATSRSLWGGTRGPLFAQAAALLEARAPAFDGRQLLVSLLGALSFYFAFAHTLGDALGGDPLAPRALRARKAHLHSLLAPLLSARSAQR